MFFTSSAEWDLVENRTTQSDSDQQHGETVEPRQFFFHSAMNLTDDRVSLSQLRDHCATLAALMLILFYLYCSVYTQLLNELQNEKVFSTPVLNSPRPLRYYLPRLEGFEIFP